MQKGEIRMKRITCLILSAVLALSLIGCVGGTSDAGRASENQQQQNNVKARYTILVYVDGANLESEGGMASEDLAEMIASTYSREDINVIVQTGGAKSWKTTGIAADSINRFRVTENNLEPLETLPQQSMVDPATLTDFINYGYEHFPADRYGLVLWDHGSGPLYGYGMDEHYEDKGTMNLSSIKTALASSSIADLSLEFLGFDSCLMASLEIADAVSPYASYLVASQEIEPGQGWDYTSWLNALGSNPEMDGASLGKVIADSFVEFYSRNSMEDASVTLSVIDLKQVKPVVTALESFIKSADMSQLSFQEVARDRSNTKEFGITPAYQSYHYDIIDIGDMAKQFSETNATESAALTDALSQAVVYSTKGPHLDIANGLSLYFPYFDRQSLADNMQLYQATGFSPAYVEFLSSFVEKLSGEPQTPMNNLSTLQPVQGSSAGSKGNALYGISIEQEQVPQVEAAYFGVWQQLTDTTYRQIYQDENILVDPDTGELYSAFEGFITTIDGEPACLYESDRGQDYVRYQTPAVLNGDPVYLEIIFDSTSPDGRLVGAVPAIQESRMAARQLIPVKEGDSLALSYYTRTITETGSEDGAAAEEEPFWQDGEAHVVGSELVINTAAAPSGKLLMSFMIYDYYGNLYETDFASFES